MMVVVMAKQQDAASTEKPHQGNMDPHLLALASSGSSEELKSLLSREDSPVIFGSCMDGSLPIQRAYDDTETITVEGVAAKANDSISSVCASSSEKPQTLFNEEEGGQACTDGAEGSLRASDDIVQANQAIAAVGDTAALVSSKKRQTLINMENGGQACGNNGRDDMSLHIRRACNDIEANELILEGVTAQGDTALHVVAAYGEGRGENFLESTCIIYGKAKHLLFEQNNEGNTPLHCAARARKSNMVKCLVNLALDEGEGRVKDLLRKENKHKETALHAAVHVGNKDIVDQMMEKDSELASFPQDGSVSPMYLAIMLKWDEIVKTLYDKSSDGKLSFSGPNGQNALHAAVVQCQDLTKLCKMECSTPVPTK